MTKTNDTTGRASRQRLKVYWLRAPVGRHRNAYLIVSARSMREAAPLLGVTLYELKRYGYSLETYTPTEARDIAAALSVPGVVLWSPDPDVQWWRPRWR